MLGLDLIKNIRYQEAQQEGRLEGRRSQVRNRAKLNRIGIKHRASVGSRC